MAAGLLLVTAALHDRLADRFAVADAWRALGNRDAEAIAEPLGGNAQMHFALSPHDNFVGLGIVLHDQRGIFIDQLGERLTELDVVLALLGGNRERQHRRGYAKCDNGGMRGPSGR